jgi:dihydrofolate reductase
MRRIVVTEFLTLDGVYQAPGGPDEDRDGGFPYGGWQMEYGHDEAQQKVRAAEVDATSAWLLGRRTYDIFAAYWPFQPDTNRWAAALNLRSKYVVSRTLSEPLSWQNTTLISDDVVARLRALKDQPGGDIRVLGSGNLVQTLIQDDLVDEFALTVYPLILGTGKRLFGEGLDARRFELVETLPGDQGAVMLIYRRNSEPIKRS